MGVLAGARETTTEGMMHVTFWKTVGAYLTGWLVAQPTYAVVRNWAIKRQMQDPPDSLHRAWRWQAIHVAEAIDKRQRLPKVCGRCKQPFSVGGGHGPGFCIERRVVDHPMVVLYVPLEANVPASATQDADIVWRETAAGVVCVKDRYGDPVCRPTLEFIVAGVRS